MITAVINGKRQKCKLAIYSGNVSFGPDAEIGVKIFPDEKKLRNYFGPDGFPILNSKGLRPDELDFNRNYWVEKELYDKVAPVIDEMGLSELKDSLLAFMQHAKVVLPKSNLQEAKPEEVKPEDPVKSFKKKQNLNSELIVFGIPENDLKKFAMNNETLKEFFERIEDHEFKILKVTIKCVKNGLPFKYDINNEYFIELLRKTLINWKQRNPEYNFLVENGLGIQLSGVNKKSIAWQKWFIYWAVGHFIYSYTELKIPKRVNKKTGRLFAAIDALPSEKDFLDEQFDKMTYPTYSDYLADLTKGIITRPPKI